MPVHVKDHIDQIGARIAPPEAGTTYQALHDAYMFRPHLSPPEQRTPCTASESPTDPVPDDWCRSVGTTGSDSNTFHPATRANLFQSKNRHSRACRNPDSPPLIRLITLDLTNAQDPCTRPCRISKDLAAVSWLLSPYLSASLMTEKKVTNRTNLP